MGATGERPHPAEWVVGLVGSLIVVGTIGFMVYEGVAAENTPPDLTVTVDSVVAMSEGFLVLVEVRNDGGSTAAGLLVEGELRGPTGTETSEATLDYVPARSARTAGLVFDEDPRHGTLTLRPKGFDRP